MECKRCNEKEHHQKNVLSLAKPVKGMIGFMEKKKTAVVSSNEF